MKLAAAVASAALLLSNGGPPIAFVDVSARSGITFHHDNQASAGKRLTETMGAGAAWIDYDNDGLLDAYLVNSHPGKRSALYRNTGEGAFIDVTEKAGAGAEGILGMGVAVADYDNDGDQDVYVLGYHRSILYRNEGNGRFADVTQSAGAANPGKWASSAAWLDYDRDGWLDVVIANYVDWTPENNIYCGEPRPGYRSYCHPNKYKGQTPTLLRNNRDGTFRDVSRASGVGSQPGNGLGVVAFDYNRDGWTDIFIANDSMANFLFLNRRDGTFEEVAIAACAAYGENGEAEAGMGVDAADYDGDGWPDLYVTHLDLELNRLYRHNRADGFEDMTFRAGPGYQTFQLSGFGTAFVDYDNDGLRDIFIANGHVLDNIHLYHPATAHAEPKFIFRNTGGRFENATPRLGPDLAVPRVSRAAAFADYDNDGDIDVLVGNNGQPAQLLRNDGGNRNNWISVRLIGTKSNRDGVGAIVTVTAGDLKSVAERKAGYSYQAAHDPRLHFGLGRRERVDSIEVRWPGGAVDRIPNVAANQSVAVKEGFGAK
jgi:hypothetical protein